jgi:hypothetical protein
MSSLSRADPTILRPLRTCPQNYSRQYLRNPMLLLECYRYDDAPGTGITYSKSWTHLKEQGLFNLQGRTQSYTGVKGS